MFAAGQQPGMQFPLAPTRDPAQADSDMAGVRTAPTESPDRGGRRPNNSACFNCRLARQRCDRQTPCSRCVSQQRTCLYPARSNRGRKQGSTNKPDTVEKLLSRISESPVCDQVVAAILDSAKTSGTNSVSLLVSPRAARTHAANATRDIPTPTTETSSSPNGLLHPPKPRDQRLAEATQAVAEIDLHGHLVSPLHILAAAVGVDTNPSQDCECPNERPCFHKQVSWNKLADPVDERVSKYFAPQATHRTDWQALASQSVDSTMRLEPSACDPVTARLIDETDAALYFSLFFEIRQPFACLLDPELHTPEQVYSRSFTLFSVICAMGCAVSVRPRDRILYPALLSMAENSMKWAIASAVKCLAVIQSIIIMQYWAPLCPRQSDDPSWLRFGHAIRLAKELGINNSATIKERVDMLCPDGSDDFKARLTRNFERAWLHTFVTDKGLSMITGRSSCLSWKQIPRAVGDWWRDPNATIYDRLISGCSEMRRLLTHVLGQGKRSERTSSAISAWHSQALRALEQLRSARCTPDEHPSATLLPILGFNMDHSILILNAQASRDLVNVDEAVTSEKFMKISLKTVEVAERMLNALLSERVIVDRVVGLHNNQFIAICHAMTEIMSAIDRGGLKQEDVDRSASTVRLIPKHLEKVAQGLPSSSVVHLYVSLSRFFAKQLDRLQAADAGGGAPGRAANELDRAPGEWWKAIDDGAIDFGTWLNMGFLSTPDNGAPFMEGMEETDESFFNDLSGF